MGQQDSMVRMISSSTITVRLDLVDRDPGQPRKTFNEESIAALAKNIAENGVLHPIYVRDHPEIPGRYMIVAGERRFRALQQLGVEEFEFRLIQGSDLPPYVISMIENNDREDLNPMEEAESYEEVMRRHGLSVAEISQYTGKHFTTIHESLRLLKLAPEVRELIRNGKLRRGKVEYFHQYRDFATQIRFAQQIIRGEHPPELEELRSGNPSQESRNRILGHLPKDADGLIRRLLEFRRRGHSALIAMQAFLAMPEEEQVKGWEKFTGATRENFEKQMREFEEGVRELNAHLLALPRTKREPSGAAAVKHATKVERLELHEAQLPIARQRLETPPPRPQKVAPKTLITPLADRNRAAEALSLLQRPQNHRGHPRKLEEAKAEDLAAGTKFLEFLMSCGSREFLSCSALSSALGNGHTPAEAEAVILRAMRCVGLAWRSPLPSEETLAKFVRFVGQFRQQTGDLTFQQFLEKLITKDFSSDPINVTYL